MCHKESLSVLVCDDSDMMRELLEEELTEIGTISGHSITVDTAMGIDSALSKLGDIDILIIDLFGTVNLDIFGLDST